MKVFKDWKKNDGCERTVNEVAFSHRLESSSKYQWCHE